MNFKDKGRTIALFLTMKNAIIILTALSLYACTNLPTNPAGSSWQKATLLNSQERVIHAKSTQKDYLIQVATIGKRPKNGYPVIYVLDGNAFFATASSIAQMAHGRPNQPTPKSLMVVGIGYTTGRQFDIPNRTQDYTPPADSYPTPKGEQVVFGGADNFHAFITDELDPLLQQQFGIHPHHRTLLGHSYGGLFALYSLYRHPNAFNHYVIASPSIWWNNKSIETHQAHFTATPALKNILITLGEYELNARHKNPNTPNSDLLSSEAYRLSQFLKEQAPNAHINFQFNAGHTHGENAYPSIIRGVHMAYQACQADVAC